MKIPAASPDATTAQLVLDDDGDRARRFRSTTEPADLSAADAAELSALHCSGSAQPSVLGFQDVRRRLGARSNDVLVVDLRQESHGFVDGAAVSWYATSNWGCAGLTDREALALESARLRLLRLADRVRIGNVEAVKHGAPATFFERERPRIADEQEAFALPPGRYIRLPVIDHTRPSDAVVDRFIALVRGLCPGQHLHFHCRGGKGRTATFMALCDMLQNAARTPLAAILARHAALGGHGHDVAKAPDPAAAKAPFLEERRAFLVRFHDYARCNSGGRPALWSRWLADNSPTD